MRCCVELACNGIDMILGLVCPLVKKEYCSNAKAVGRSIGTVDLPYADTVRETIAFY